MRNKDFMLPNDKEISDKILSLSISLDILSRNEIRDLEIHIYNIDRDKFRFIFGQHL